MTSDLVGKPSIVPKSQKNPLKLQVEVILTPLSSLPSFAQRSPTHQSMQNLQGYPLITSNLMGKPSLLLRNLKNHPKPSVAVIRTPLYTHLSFAQGSPTHLSMQNLQGYPLMTSNLMGKSSLLPRSPKNHPKPSVEVIVNPLYSHPSFAQRSPTHQRMENHQCYPLNTSNLMGERRVSVQRGSDDLHRGSLGVFGASR
jgi:hypothetical protein